MRRWAWVWLPLAFLVTVMGWALTSPVGSSPDDDYHLSSIWCAQGVRAGVCEEVPGDPMARAVPAAVVQAADCYRFDPASIADCARRPPGRRRPGAPPTGSTRPPACTRAASTASCRPVRRRPMSSRRCCGCGCSTRPSRPCCSPAMLRLLPAGIVQRGGPGDRRHVRPARAVPRRVHQSELVDDRRHRRLLGLRPRPPATAHPGRTGAGCSSRAGVVLAALMAIGSRVDASAYLVLTHRDRGDARGLAAEPPHAVAARLPRRCCASWPA